MGRGNDTALWIACTVVALTGCGGSDGTATRTPATRPAATEATSAATDVSSSATPSGPTTFSAADDRGDVVSTSKESDWFDDAVRSPRQSVGDIVGLSVTHGPDEIVARIRIAELGSPRDGSPGSSMRISLRLLTSGRADRDVEVWVGTDAPDLEEARVLPKDDGSCRTRHAVDTRRDTVVLVTGRACLGAPQWVRVAAHCLSFPDARTMSLDVALVDGYGRPGRDELSPRVYRP